MARDFQLTAELYLTGPKNVKLIADNLSRLQVPASVQQSFSKLTGNVGKLRNATSALNKVVSNLGQAYKGANTNIKQTGASVQKTHVSTIQAASSMENFGRTVGFVTTRLIGFRIASGLVLGFGGAIRTAVTDAIAFERELARVAQVTNKDISQLFRLNDTIKRLGVSYGVSSKDLIEVSRTLSQTGLSARDTRLALEALAKSTLLPTFGEMNQTVEGSIAIFNQFKIEAKDLWKVLSAIDAVSGSLAVESSDVVIAVQKAGGVFAALNKDVGNSLQSFNEFLAIFSTIRQTTRESASNIGVGLRTIFLRMQRPATIEFLRQFNVELQTTGKNAGEVLKPLEMLDKLSKAFGNVGARNLNIGKVVQQLSGTRQAAKMLPLLFEQELRKKALAIATDAQTASEEKLAKALNTLQVRMGQVKEQFTIFVRDVVQSNTFQFLARGALNFVSALIQVANALKPLLSVITALGAIKLLSGGMHSIAALFVRGFASGVGGNPLGGQVGLGNAGSISQGNIGNVGNTVQSGALNRNTAALHALTTQLSSVALGGVGGGQLSRIGGHQLIYPAGSFNSTFIPMGQVAAQTRKYQAQSAAKAQRAAQSAQRRRVAGGVGIAAGIVGASYASEYIGSSTKSRAAASGGLTGAVQGGLLGGILSKTPQGAVIVGLIGMLGSATQAVSQFKRSLLQNKIEDATEGIEQTFIDLNKKLINETDARAFLVKKIQDQSQNIKKLNAKIYWEITDDKNPAFKPKIGFKSNEAIKGLSKGYKSFFKDNADEIEKTIQAMFKEGKTISQIPQELLIGLAYAVGNVDKVVEESGSSLSVYERKMKELGIVHGGIINRTVQWNKVIEQTNFALDFSEDNLRKFNAGLKAISDTAGQTHLTAAQTALSRSQGKTTIGGITTKNVFSNLEGFSKKTIASNLTNLGVTGSLAANVNLARALPEILSSISSLVANSDATEITEAFIKKVDEALPRRSDIADVFIKRLRASSTAEPLELYKILSKELPETLSLSVKAVDQFQEGLNKAVQNIHDAQQQYVQLYLQQAASLGEIRASRTSMMHGLTAAGGGKLTLGQQLAPGNAQLQSLGVGATVQQISANRDRAIREKNYLLQGKTLVALELLANSTDKLTVIQNKVAEFEQKRLSAQNVAQDIFSKGPEERLKMAAELRAYIRFQKGGKLTDAAFSGGKSLQKMVEGQNPQLANKINTRITRGIPGAEKLFGGIAVKGQGQAAPQGLMQLYHQVMAQINQARMELHNIRTREMNKFLLESQKAFSEQAKQLYKSLEKYETVTTALSQALNNSQIDVNVNVPTPIPVVVQGGGIVAQEIGTVVAKMVRLELLKVLPNRADLNY